MALFKVSTKAQFYNALEKASSGDTIELTKNLDNASALYIQNQRFNADNPITITASEGVEVESRFVIRESQGVTIEDMTITAENWVPNTKHAGAERLIRVADSHGITINDVDFRGRIVSQEEYNELKANNFQSIHYRADHATYVGLGIRGSTDVEVSGSSFKELNHGIEIGGWGKTPSRNVTIEDNYFTEIRTDGIRGGDHDGTTIARNIFENFNPYRNATDTGGDHGDFIQYWANGDYYGIKNFTIEDNVFNQQGNEWTQTIFGRHALQGDTEYKDVPFENFKITGNQILNGHLHGITLTGINGLEVTDNMVLGNELSLNLETGRMTHPVHVPSINIGFESDGGDSGRYNLANGTFYNSKTGQWTETALTQNAIVANNVTMLPRTTGENALKNMDALSIDVTDSFVLNLQQDGHAEWLESYTKYLTKMESIGDDASLSTTERYDAYDAAGKALQIDLGFIEDNGENFLDGSGETDTGDGSVSGGLISIADAFEKVLEQVTGRADLSSASELVYVAKGQKSFLNGNGGADQFIYADANKDQHRLVHFSEDDAVDLSRVFEGSGINENNYDDYVDVVSREFSNGATRTEISVDLDGAGNAEDSVMSITIHRAYLGTVDDMLDDGTLILF
ncbi:type I secretion C-terminal target domain-containing protein [Paracoccaceae bacterium GXU_MW_L88]